MLEAVRRRVAKLIPSLLNKSNNCRFKKLNMFKFMNRFLRGYIIEVHKTLNDMMNERT